MSDPNSHFMPEKNPGARKEMQLQQSFFVARCSNLLIAHVSQPVVSCADGKVQRYLLLVCDICSTRLKSALLGFAGEEARLSVAAFESIHHAFAAWHQSRARSAGTRAIMIALVCVLLGVPVAGGAPLTPFPAYIKPVCSAGDGYGFGSGFRFDLNREGFHPGLDFDVEPGFPVYAAAAGTVISAGARGPYGLAVDIDHGRGHRTRYGHLAMLAVSAGQRVPQGATIGWSGATGLTTKPVLHFEVWRNDVVHDPGVRIGPNWRCFLTD